MPTATGRRSLALSRWLKVTKFVNDHSGLPERSEKEIVNEAKTIQKDAGNAPIDTARIEKKHNDTVINDVPTQRVEPPAPEPAKPAPEPEVDRTSQRPCTAQHATILTHLEKKTVRWPFVPNSLDRPGDGGAAGRYALALRGRLAFHTRSPKDARVLSGSRLFGCSAPRVPAQRRQALGPRCGQGADPHQAAGHEQSQGPLGSLPSMNTIASSVC